MGTAAVGTEACRSNSDGRCSGARASSTTRGASGSRNAGCSAPPGSSASTAAPLAGCPAPCGRVPRPLPPRRRRLFGFCAEPPCSRARDAVSGEGCSSAGAASCSCCCGSGSTAVGWPKSGYFGCSGASAAVAVPPVEDCGFFRRFMRSRIHFRIRAYDNRARVMFATGSVAAERIKAEVVSTTGILHNSSQSELPVTQRTFPRVFRNCAHSAPMLRFLVSFIRRACIYCLSPEVRWPSK